MTSMRSLVERADPGVRATAPSSTIEWPGVIRPIHWAGTMKYPRPNNPRNAITTTPWRSRSRYQGSAAVAPGLEGEGGSISFGVSASFIVLVIVLATGMLFGATRPPAGPEPATLGTASGRGSRERVGGGNLWASSSTHDDETNIAMDTLRVLGLVRRRVDRPVVGRKAYVRWWERLRALVVLTAIVVGLGVLLAVVVGVTILGFGFLLERAIS